MSNYGGNTSQANAAVPRDRTLTEGVRDGIANIGERLATLTNRLASLSQRTCGGQDKSEDPRTSPPRPVPNGAFHSIEMQLKDVAAQVEVLHAIAEKLDTIA